MNESIQSYNSSFFLVVASSFFIYILIEQEFSVFIELNNCTFSRRIRILSYVVWLYYCAIMVLLWFFVFTYFISFRIYWLRNHPRKRQHTLSHFFRRKNLSKPLPVQNITDFKEQHSHKKTNCHLDLFNIKLICNKVFNENLITYFMQYEMRLLSTFLS